MVLSERLGCILNMVDKCGCIADIGTDHGYLVIEAVESGKAERGIASDINKGPIERAEKNIRMQKLSERIDTRLGGGLATLKVDEVNCAVVAGMGGNLVRDILTEKMDVVKKLDQLVLQPSQNPEVLRKFLYENGFSILDEDICKDNDIFYEIMKVKYTGEEKKLYESDYEISPVLMNKGLELFKEYIESKIDKNEKTMTYIDASSENGRAKMKYLEEKNIMLKGKLNEL